MTPEQLREMHVALKAQRDELVQEANRQIAFLNGKMELIDELLRGVKDASPNGEIHEMFEVEAAD